MSSMPHSMQRSTPMGFSPCLFSDRTGSTGLADHDKLLPNRENRGKTLPRHSERHSHQAWLLAGLMLTCCACDVEPYAYLHHLLTELPQRALC